MQRAGRRGGLRPQQDHSRSEEVAARRRDRTLRAVPQQHAFRAVGDAGAPLRFHARRSGAEHFGGGDERHPLRRFRAADGRSDGIRQRRRQASGVVGRHGRVDRPQFRRGFQARREVARAVSRLQAVQRLRRIAVAQRGIAVPHRRTEHRRGVGHVNLRFRRLDVPHRGAFHREGAQDRAGGRQGDPRTAPVPDRSGVGLPLAEPLVALAFGRRVAAHPAGDAGRIETGECTLHPRRAVDRPAPARQPAADPQLAGVARCRQLGDRRRARRGDDALSRLDRRRRPQGGAQGRPRRCVGYVRRHPPLRLRDGRLSDRPPADRGSGDAARGQRPSYRPAGSVGQ